MDIQIRPYCKTGDTLEESWFKIAQTLFMDRLIPPRTNENECQPLICFVDPSSARRPVDSCLF